MKKPYIISILITLILFFISACQKTKEPEVKKEELRQISISDQERETEMQSGSAQNESESPVPFVQPEQPPKIQPSPLTAEEQQYVKETTWGLLMNARESEPEFITRYLKIILKGNHRNIVLHDHYEGLSEEERKKVFSDVIALSLEVIDPTEKEGFKLAVKVLETMTEYPEGMAAAARAVKFSGDKSVIPLLQKTAKHPSPKVRLESAASLLIMGDADTALPVLDQLAEKEDYPGSLYYLFRGPGKIIDERGYPIVEKALNNPKAEVRITAVKLLFESKKIKKEKAEEIALTLVDKYKAYTLKNYGLTLTPNEIYRIVPYPNSGLTDIKSSEYRKYSDSRACEKAIDLLSNLKSIKAIPILKYIEQNNTDVGFVCKDTNARSALFVIEGGKK